MKREIFLNEEVWLQKKEPKPQPQVSLLGFLFQKTLDLEELQQGW